MYLQQTLYNENANLVLENAKDPAKVKNANSPFIVRVLSVQLDWLRWSHRC